MGVDLHRIGLGISSGNSRNGFGNIVSFPSVSGFPAAGSYNSTLNDVTYPIANGGASVTVLSVAYPSQTCDVDVENDGSGGTYTDWTTATDVQYKAYGEGITTDPTPEPAGVEVPSGSSNYFTGGTYQNGYFHDGVGGSYSGGVNYSYYSDGDNTNLTGLNEPAYTQVPGGGSNYNNGTYTGYTWNGSGGYNYPVSGGSYYSAGTFVWENVVSTGGTSIEIPYGSGNYFNNTVNGDRYTWNGSGSYNYEYSWYYAYGTYITTDGGTTFYWDGNGDIYSETP